MRELGDPAASPRFPYRGEVRRESPVATWTAVGPWAADVAVTPLSGLRAALLLFEVSAAWGPGRDRTLPDVPGLTGQPTRRAYDQVVVEDLELARAIAMAAVDALRRPDVPRLPDLERRFQTNPTGGM